ncbi:MAG: electron transfer flavoprotein subunit alpha/FixB family protein [Anaerovibrio sp.]|uniref:electron transfer flavoprotein subunit alpha/FixB family protein n=1 Tax=Anaerovibrio sp. TaxID=1872532 RepID=UPI0025CD89BC|nr:electron transfer flavoprotein subunit alpha/FixB family protein [Anaerovibrio sp.]MCR5175575.1 electron transfer flavoprotein subunit alpha/FixB family protein [Anaerovibrio sp.]
MGKLVVHQEKITDIKEMISICPFNALEENDGKLEVNAGCKLCKLCVKKGQPGVMEYIEEEVKSVDKSLWKGITVYVDHVNGEIHPVTLELLGKAGELAKKINHPVYALFIGSGIGKKAEELLHYGVDKVFVIDAPELKEFQMESYTAAFETFVNEIKPTAILVGATPVGRQLAPRVASRFNTGLTADCTILDIHENTDLVQIRPAFGGNIMAEILTPNSRPQLATVRYKIMDAPERTADAKGEIVTLKVASDKLKTRTEVLGITQKQKEKSIENADILVVAGRGLKKKEDLDLVKELADALGGDIACTRPLAEAGWLDAKHQIGLSGRTVRPRLIITCGVSGAIQFVAGMNNSDNIFAINTDPNASIFKVANYAVIGDIYDVIPKLIEQVKQGKGVTA